MVDKTSKGYIKENGFTLVELLAVIVILALLLTIAIPQITKLIAKSKVDAFEASVKMGYDAIKMHLVDSDHSEEVSGNLLDLQTYNTENITEGTWQIVDDEIYLCNVKSEDHEVVGEDPEGCYIIDEIEVGLITVAASPSVPAGDAIASSIIGITALTDIDTTGVQVGAAVTDLFVNDGATTTHSTTEDYASEYYYKGENPNNLLVFDDKCWSIINITNNGSVKIIYEGAAIGSSPNQTCTRNSTSGKLNDLLYEWDATATNVWADAFVSGDIGYLLNTTFYGGIGATNQAKVATGTWYIGTNVTDWSWVAIISTEYPSTWSGNVGMITPSEYGKASGGTSVNLNDVHDRNFLYKGYDYWTITAGSSGVYLIYALPDVTTTWAANDFGARPVLFLASDVSITGSGTDAAPFIVE